MSFQIQYSMCIDKFTTVSSWSTWIFFVLLCAALPPTEIIMQYFRLKSWILNKFVCLHCATSVSFSSNKTSSMPGPDTSAENIDEILIEKTLLWAMIAPHFVATNQETFCRPSHLLKHGPPPCRIKKTSLLGPTHSKRYRPWAWHAQEIREGAWRQQQDGVGEAWGSLPPSDSNYYPVLLQLTQMNSNVWS